MTESITPVEYKAFQKAYDFFNKELFGNHLPHVLVTLQRKARARGYFSPDRFSGRIDDSMAHELALNPDTFTDRTDEAILSTLVHEMAHVWRQVTGDHPPTRGYHDKIWAGKMKEIGLHPSSTGEAGGKETGQSVTHYIVAGGPFSKACAALLAKGFQLHWESAPQGKQGRAKNASKTKFSCSNCGQNGWAKPDAVLICGACGEDRVMVAGAQGQACEVH